MPTATEPPSTPGAPAAPLRRNRDFALITAGQTVSTIGNGMSSLALLLLTFAVTRSTGLAGVVAAGSTLGYALASLPAGAYVDRWNRKHVMVWSSFAGFLVMGSIPLAALVWQLTFPHLLAVAILSGVRSAFYGPAETASVKRVVPAPQLGEAAAVNQARAQIGSLAGPPLAGLLYAVGRVLPILVDALTFLVAALAAAFLRTDLSAPARDARSRMTADIREGLGFIWRVRGLRDSLTVALLVNATVNGLIATALLALQQAGTAPVKIGLVDTVAGLCGLGGALVASSVVARVRVGRVLVLALIGAIAAATAMTAWNAWWWVAAMMAAIVLVASPLNVGLFSYQQYITPDALQGRVATASGLMAMGITPLATASAGFLLGWFGRVPTMLTFAALSAVPLALAMLSPAIRSIPRTTDFGDAAGRPSATE